jgi:TATA-box binding protein (TBP) (component of TFIID and TFIIIB)
MIKDDATTIDEEWLMYQQGLWSKTSPVSTVNDDHSSTEAVDTCSELYISTKSKMIYLDRPIDFESLFWSTPVLPYIEPSEGVVKKQIKLITTSREGLELVKTRLAREDYVEEIILSQKDETSTTTKGKKKNKQLPVPPEQLPVPPVVDFFRDTRKISVGLCKKDLFPGATKSKSAFYNCVVVVLRLLCANDEFREFHVKIFNTGKLEIPGVKNDDHFAAILRAVVRLTGAEILPHTEQTILINSNFHCGFTIRREVMEELLNNKYNIQAMYDPCSYAGIQATITFPEYDTVVDSSKTRFGRRKISHITFLIFRTGSVLVGGKCNEDRLYAMYERMKEILIRERSVLCQEDATTTKHVAVIQKSGSKPFKSRAFSMTATTTT